MIEIIPAIDIIGGKCVRLTRGDYSLKKVYSDDPVIMAKQFGEQGFHRLHVVDLDGAAAGMLVNIGIVREICRSTVLPVDFGGGIRSRTDIEMLFDAGVKQITAGSMAARNREVFLEWLHEFGPERIILGADVRDNLITVSGWRETIQTGVIDFIGSYIKEGIKTVICTDTGRDGMMTGPATELYSEILDKYPGIELIASGGVSSDGDLGKLEAAGVKSVIVGKALYEKGSAFTPSMPFTPSTPCIRIIPCLDVKNGRVVKGTNFEGLRDAGDPVELASRYSREGADELVFLDITATGEKRKTMADMVRRVAETVSIPFTVGGGISTAEDVSLLLSCGADKVSVNSAAVGRPELIADLAERFGSQCVVVAVDAGQDDNGEWKVFVNGGKQATGIGLFDWVVEAVRLGAGEILFTSIDNDGTGKGFACDALYRIKSLVRVPLIASGGAGKPEHFLEAATTGGATGLLAAGLFHYGKLSIPALKKYLNDNGVRVRI
jgi:phosphoribosylformimino-5-aminoimidazole carboxamide ribotide isomerase